MDAAARGLLDGQDVASLGEPLLLKEDYTWERNCFAASKSGLWRIGKRFLRNHKRSRFTVG